MTDQSLLLALFNTCSTGLVLLDASRRVVLWNDWMAKLSGIPAAMAYGKSFQQLFPDNPRTAELSRGVKLALVRGASARLADVLCINGWSGSAPEAQWQHCVHIKPLEGNGSGRHCLLQVEPLAAVRASSADDTRRAVTAQRVVEDLSDGVVTTDAEGYVDYMNRAAAELLDRSPQELAGLSLAEVLQPEDTELRTEISQRIAACLGDRFQGPLLEDGRMLRRDGSALTLDDRIVPLRSEPGRVVGCTLVIHNSDANHTTVERLSYQANHDDLTGLFNRREFERRLDAALHSARTQQRRHTLCYIDLDRFKVVNDTCGHFAGDELLHRVAELFSGRIRSGDTLARLGGDEFGLLLRDCGTENAQTVLQKLHDDINHLSFMWDGKTFDVGMSAGVVEVTGDDQESSSLMTAADNACYAAKEHGRNRTWTYREDDRTSKARQGGARWVTRIQDAIAEDRLVLFGQAIVPVDPHVEGHLHYEILLRLQERSGELIPPMAFIPAAERHDLMSLLDRWVLGTALSYLETHRGFREALNLLSINLSGQSLGDESFLHFVEEQLRSSQVDPSLLCFEITETAAIARLNAATQFISALRQMGCKFALDDFGSGLSSLAYLKALPVDFIKIDGAFVRHINQDSVDAAMVESINRIAHVVNMRTIAEFVESDEVLIKLRDLGVDYAQGWGIAQPQPLDSLAARLPYRKTA